MERDVMEKLAYSIEELSELSTLSVLKIRRTFKTKTRKQEEGHVDHS